MFYNIPDACGRGPYLGMALTLISAKLLGRDLLPHKDGSA